MGGGAAEGRHAEERRTKGKCTKGKRTKGRRFEERHAEERHARRPPGDRVEAVPWEKAEGRIALEYAYLYPPGIPLVVPGERIGKAAAEQLSAYEQMGFSIEGTEAEGKIEVWING